MASSFVTSIVYNFKFYGLVGSSPQVGRKTTSNDKSHNKDVLSTADDSASYTFSSICAGTFYGFSPLVWTYAVGSEVFAMNNFFASYILYLTCKYVVALTMDDRSTSPLSHAYYGAFVFGLGLCNQHTLILYEVPLVLYILYTLYIKYSGKLPLILLKLGISFICGMSPYVYLYWSDKYNLRRGSWGDSSTLSGFIKHFRRADYGTFQLFSGNSGKNSEGLIERLGAHFNDFVETQTFLGYFSVVLVLIGCMLPLPVVAAARVVV